jgi:mRNA-degrading endonuclease RelE of RelBE toxin-antitoxin system
VSVRGARVPRPPSEGEWTLRYTAREVAVEWEKLCSTHASAARRAYDYLTQNPRQRTERNFRLKGELGTCDYRGRTLERWQHEVTGGGRIFFLIDDERRTVWLQQVYIGHPKATE